MRSHILYDPGNWANPESVPPLQSVCGVTCNASFGEREQGRPNRESADQPVDAVNLVHTRIRKGRDQKAGHMPIRKRGGSWQVDVRTVEGKRILIRSCAERERSARDAEFMGFVTGHDFSRAADGRRGYGGL